MSPTSDRLKQILEKQTGRTFETFAPSSTLEELGVDSFDFIDFLFAVEDEFGVAIDYRANDFSTRIKTVGDVVSYIEGFLAVPGEGGELAAQPKAS